jgi:hypothetical protein
VNWRAYWLRRTESNRLSAAYEAVSGCPPSPHQSVLGQDRTGDFPLRRRALFRLSYEDICVHGWARTSSLRRRRALHVLSCCVNNVVFSPRFELGMPLS